MVRRGAATRHATLAFLLMLVGGCAESNEVGSDAGPVDAARAGDAGPECPRLSGNYRILVTELDGDCGDFVGVARIDDQPGGCSKNTVYRDSGCTIDLDTTCEEEEEDGSITTRRTRGTVRRIGEGPDYMGMIEFAIRSSVEPQCSGTFELRYEMLGDDAGL